MITNPPLKSMVFRIPEALKNAFRIVVIKNNTDVQHTFEAFAELMVSHDRGDKIADPIKFIIKRAQTLSGAA